MLTVGKNKWINLYSLIRMTHTISYRFDSLGPLHVITKNCIRLDLYFPAQPLLYIWLYAGYLVFLHSTVGSCYWNCSGTVLGLFCVPGLPQSIGFYFIFMWCKILMWYFLEQNLHKHINKLTLDCNNLHKACRWLFLKRIFWHFKGMISFISCWGLDEVITVV